jgi:hypothetical protein
VVRVVQAEAEAQPAVPKPSKETMKPPPTGPGRNQNRGVDPPPVVPATKSGVHDTRTELMRSGKSTRSVRRSAGGIFPDGTTDVVGGRSDREQRDSAPAGGLLVGFELGMAPFFRDDIPRAIRPIYLTGKKISYGKQYGTRTGKLAKVVAKEGYAVAAVTARAGLVLDGFSVTFARVTDDGLDMKDSYESEWIGGGNPSEVYLGGDGSHVVGIVVKTSDRGRDRDCNGLGLILKKP